MAQIWLMTLQVAAISFILSVLVAVGISAIRTLLRRTLRKKNPSDMESR